MNFDQRLDSIKDRIKHYEDGLITQFELQNILMDQVVKLDPILTDEEKEQSD